MKFRITVCAGLGFLVAVSWAVYSFSANPSPITPAEPIVWHLALLTQPIALAIESCINNAIMDVEVRDTYAQIEGERRSS